eukprot:TRINITY_DN4036_c0_g1_i3.p1 TRINITY_DN4036_c0_g1~~TRINITY_DN4036_c0_g1_i3.p1  ORF type:complete len:101 (-),score=21.09 TRINITY_DN4036_c0_g1_i3:45-347(-)
MIRRPPRSTLSSSSAASDVYKRQLQQHHPSSTTTSLKYTLEWPPKLKRQELPYSNHPLNSTPPAAPFTMILLSLIHISEPTRLLSISYAVFCLKKKKKTI